MEPLPPYLATPQEVAAFTPDTGVGEAALTEVRSMPSAGVLFHSFALRMPKDPLPGQRRPPGDQELQQKVIKGGCWVGPLGTKKPPCGNEAFDYEGGCYLPVVTLRRQPASEQP